MADAVFQEAGRQRPGWPCPPCPLVSLVPLHQRLVPAGAFPSSGRSGAGSSAGFVPGHERSLGTRSLLAAVPGLAVPCAQGGWHGQRVPAVAVTPPAPLCAFPKDGPKRHHPHGISVVPSTCSPQGHSFVPPSVVLGDSSATGDRSLCVCVCVCVTSCALSPLLWVPSSCWRSSGRRTWCSGPSSPPTTTGRCGWVGVAMSPWGQCPIPVPIPTPFLSPQGPRQGQ